MEKKSKKYAIAFDMGATYIRVAIGDEGGVFVSELKEKTTLSKEKNALSKQLTRMVNLLEKPSNISGIGIGVAGQVDFKNLKVYSPDYALKNFFLKQFIKNSKNKVYILNDCNTAVLGIKKFESKSENLVYITISSGLGSGVIDNGHLVLGKDCLAPEAGHMVLDYNGKQKCSCGGFGHWEGYASGENMHRFFKLYTKGNKITELKAEDIFNKAKEKNKTALGFIDELGKINSAGIAGVINVFNPEEIFLGGSVVLKNKNLILNPIKKYIKKYLFNPPAKIKISKLADKVVLYGALSLVFDKKNNQRLRVN